MASLVQKGTKTTQPTLWCLQDEGVTQQQFIVIELSSHSYIHGLLVLLAVYFAFDLCYDINSENQLSDFLKNFFWVSTRPKNLYSTVSSTGCCCQISEVLGQVICGSTCSEGYQNNKTWQPFNVC